MKCTPSPTADIKMEAMPGAGAGAGLRQGQGGQVRVREPVEVCGSREGTNQEGMRKTWQQV